MDSAQEGMQPRGRVWLDVERHGGGGGTLRGSMYFRDGLVFIGGEPLQSVLANLMNVDPREWKAIDGVRITVEVDPD